MPIYNEGYVSITKVCLMLNLSHQTIQRWYRWWDNDEFKKPQDVYLPPYYFKDRRKTKYFKEEDVKYLQKFHEQLQTTHKGLMADFNAAFQWGKRGDKILRKRNLTAREIKNKFL